MDDSRITDDEDIEHPKNTSYHLKNQIFFSGETTSKPTKIQSHRRNDSETIDTLRYSDSDETNCSLSIVKPAVNTMNSQRKDSTPLFSECSAEHIDRLSRNICHGKNTETDDTIITSLSTQFDQLELDKFAEIANLPDDDKTLNSLLIKNHNENLLKTDIAEVDTILTISSENEEESEYSNEEDIDDSNEVIMISDSDADDKKESNETEYDHVSSIVTHSTNESMSQTTRQKIDYFFNNIPPLESGNNLLYNNDNKPENNIKSLHIQSPLQQQNPCELHKSISNSEMSLSVKEFVPDEEEIIPETPEDSLCNSSSQSFVEPADKSEEILVSEQRESAIASKHCSNKIELSFEETTINISTKIKINIHVKELPDCSSLSSGSSADGNANCNSINDIENNEDVSDRIDEVSAEKDEKSEEITTSTKKGKFDELNKTNFEIDEDMEEILNEMYGIEWQTPQLLLKCSSRKPKILTWIQENPNSSPQRLKSPDNNPDFSLCNIILYNSIL